MVTGHKSLENNSNDGLSLGGGSADGSFDWSNEGELLSQAQRFMGIGKSVEARQLLDTILKANPNHIGAMQLMGRLHMSTEDFESAAAVFAKIANYQPNDPQNLNSLAMAYIMAQKPKEARAYLEKAVSIDPKSRVYLTNLGKFFMTEGLWREAHQHLDRALDYASSIQKGELKDLLAHCREKLSEQDTVLTPHPGESTLT